MVAEIFVAFVRDRICVKVGAVYVSWYVTRVLSVEMMVAGISVALVRACKSCVSLASACVSRAVLKIAAVPTVVVVPVARARVRICALATPACASRHATKRTFVETMAAAVVAAFVQGRRTCASREPASVSPSAGTRSVMTMAVVASAELAHRA